MQEEPPRDKGLTFAAAVEQWGNPELWKAAAEITRLKPIEIGDLMGWRLPERPDRERMIRLGAYSEYLSQESAWQRAARGHQNMRVEAARRANVSAAPFDDFVHRLADREFIAWGMHEKPGTGLAGRREMVHPDLWPYRWKRDRGSKIRFGPFKNPTIVDNILIYRAEDCRCEISKTEDGADQRRESRRPGRPPAPFWAAAEEEAMRWLADEGYPMPGDGRQAELERHIASWLQERGHEPAEPTIRNHVRDWIAKFRVQIGAVDEDKNTN